MTDIKNFYPNLMQKYPNAKTEYFQQFETPDKLPIYGGVVDDKYYFKIDIPSIFAEEAKKINDCAGYSVHRIMVNRTTMEIRLYAEKKEFISLFFSVIQDVVDFASSEGQSVMTILARLQRWSDFFKKSPRGVLSYEKQIGLFGELAYLDELISRYGLSAFDSWQGPVGLSKDFIFGKFAVEVKSTIQSDFNKIKISNEKQLDSVDFDSLYLLLNILIEDQMNGYSIPEMVDIIKGKLGENPSYEERFISLLHSVGYDSSFASKYEDYFSKLYMHIFEVTENFPKITTANIGKGVSNVSYSIDVSECIPYESIKKLNDNLELYFNESN